MSFDAKRPLAEAQPQPTAFEVRVLDGLERKRPGRKKKMKENLIKELLSFNPHSPPAMRMLATTIPCEQSLGNILTPPSVPTTNFKLD